LSLCTLFHTLPWTGKLQCGELLHWHPSTYNQNVLSSTPQRHVQPPMQLMHNSNKTEKV
jgi:hypothetical protein